jgi:hypothetical protein
MKMSLTRPVGAEFHRHILAGLGRMRQRRASGKAFPDLGSVSPGWPWPSGLRCSPAD